MDDLHEIARTLEARDNAIAIRKLQYYNPYEYQLEFHGAVGFKTTRPAKQRFLLAANGVGKTLCGAMEAAMHMTGRYPDWFNGTRFNRPVEIVIGAKTNDAAVKVVQKELFGDIMDKSKIGTGTLPKEAIDKNFQMKPGVPGAIGKFMVKHISGKWSTGAIMSYDQKAKAFMGTRFDVGWLDEEPPQDIWSQFMRGVLSRENAILYITATPEEGMTQIVIQFMRELKTGQAIINATWDDAPHLGAEEKEQKLATFPQHEREMRSQGVPLMGTGLIFPFSAEDLKIDPIKIPDYWPQIIGIDFGINHPFAAAKLAWDRDSDTVYLTAEHRVKDHVPMQHVDVLKKWGDYPVAWPHDGLNREAGTGDELRSFYKDLDMLPERATNPPDVNQKEGEGGNSREASVLALYNRMEEGKFRVFSTCTYFLEEIRMYHRDEHGRIVDTMDDAISACFHPDTMVLTKGGPRKIVDLVGEEGKVLTTGGKYTDFVHCRKTRTNADVVDVVFEDGSHIVCTPEHLFLTACGWIKAVDLEGLRCYNAISHSEQARCILSTKVSGTRNSPAITDRQKNFCIDKFGQTPTARFLRDVIFTIKTAIGKTTISPILNASMAKNISRCTNSAIKDIPMPDLLRSLFGTSQKKAGSFTSRWAKRMRTTCMRSVNFLASAASLNSFQPLRGLVFAQTSANPNGGGRQASITRNEFAWNAALNSTPINFQIPDSARKHVREEIGSELQKEFCISRVLRVASAGKSDVYCLEVPSTEAFALGNGVVVHNCRYAHMSLRHARTKIVKSKKQHVLMGARNW